MCVLINSQLQLTINSQNKVSLLRHTARSTKYSHTIQVSDQIQDCQTIFKCELHVAGNWITSDFKQFRSSIVDSLKSSTTSEICQSPLSSDLGSLAVGDVAGNGGGI